MDNDWTPVAEHVDPHSLCCDDCKRLRVALIEIRDQEWIENTLDPQWAARIARAALLATPESEKTDG